MAPTIAASIAVASLALGGGIYLKYPTLASSLCPQTCTGEPNTLHSGYFTYECAGKPHHSSWGSWWHPQRVDGEHKQGAGATTRDWNVLYHLGGNGPWVEKVVDVVEGGIKVPEGCVVEQVHMVCIRRE